jgi:hypothetical protein
MMGIIEPNSIDIEFRIVESPDGLIMTCTECDATWFVSKARPWERFNAMNKHRAEHFGEMIPPDLFKPST